MGVGRQLRHQREARGWSVREIAERTKIPSRLIELLEAEQYERLPGGIFGRGYVRAVADAVGLDGLTLSEEFRTELEPSRSTQFSIADEPVTTGPRLRLAAEPDPPAKTGRAIAAVLLAISVILVMLWFGIERSVDGSSRRDPTAPPSGPRPVADARRPSSDQLRSRHGEPGAVATTGTITSTAAAPPMQLTLEATRPCWVALTADGERVIYRMLSAGERASVRLRDRGILRTGDAAALKLAINGKELPAMGSSGEVRTIEITPANYRSLLGRMTSH
jgi:transcriptional regulator with XRE-family HTH domain